MNLKHIKEALKLAGLRKSDVAMKDSRRGHVTILYNGNRVVASCSPKDEHTAAIRIAKDLLQ